MPTYSFGLKSPIKFEYDRQEAALVNSSIDAIFKAYKKFEEKYGVIDPTAVYLGDLIYWTAEEQRAFKAFREYFYGFVLFKYGKEEIESAYMGDYLVVNETHAFGPRLPEKRRKIAWIKAT